MSVKKKLESNLVGRKEWQSKYPKVFETNVEYGTGSYLKNVKVEATDIEWCIL